MIFILINEKRSRFLDQGLSTIGKDLYALIKQKLLYKYSFTTIIYYDKNILNTN